jgi:hypothetical protein
MSSREEIIENILNHGKRSWNKADDCDGDTDVFYSEIVVELRTLHDEGLFENLREHQGSRRASTHTGRVDIKGSINYNFRSQH